mmetsp:Transcript_9225/g.8635  ORF Transcript_9225/g.8635 Transcript_9225/m.8635 type:complete len:244 (+) Transcript_9225:431-1162(+)
MVFDKDYSNAFLAFDEGSEPFKKKTELNLERKGRENLGKLMKDTYFKGREALSLTQMDPINNSKILEKQMNYRASEGDENGNQAIDDNSHTIKTFYEEGESLVSEAPESPSPLLSLIFTGEDEILSQSFFGSMMIRMIYPGLEGTDLDIELELINGEISNIMQIQDPLSNWSTFVASTYNNTYADRLLHYWASQLHILDYFPTYHQALAIYTFSRNASYLNYLHLFEWDYLIDHCWDHILYFN